MPAVTHSFPRSFIRLYKCSCAQSPSRACLYSRTHSSSALSINICAHTLVLSLFSCAQSLTHPCSPLFAHMCSQTFKCSVFHSYMRPLLGLPFPSPTHAFFHPPSLSPMHSFSHAAQCAEFSHREAPKYLWRNFFGRQHARWLRACSVAAITRSAPKHWDPTA